MRARNFGGLIAITVACAACSGTGDTGSSDSLSTETSQELAAAVSPRVNCGGYNGQVRSSSASVSTWGELWNTCGSGTNYLYLNLSSCSPAGGTLNDPIAVAGPNRTVGVKPTTVPFLAKDPSNVDGCIKFTVCSTHGGWHCGTPKSI